MFRFSRKRIIFFIIGLFFLVGLFLSLGLGFYLINPAEKGRPNQILVFTEGMSLKKVADELERKKIIKSSTLFMLWARMMGYSRKIKAGEYLLSPNMPPLRIFEILTRGAVITHPVTIPEGFTNEDIADLLSRRGLVNKLQFLSLTTESALLSKYGISGPSLEGYLYPDTYLFARGLSASKTIDAMVKRFWQVVGPLKGRVEDQGMKIEEVVILASIVEKETGSPKERPTIASVFLNRLRRRMRLESDPTVIYGLKDFDGNLTRKDLSKHTPYNTYRIRGLPPGPIANPGLESIKAVLYPARTDYLYFVSKNDGSHYFSKTLSEHNRAVARYQKKRRRRR